MPRVNAVFIEHGRMGATRRHELLPEEGVDILLRALLHLAESDNLGMNLLEGRTAPMGLVQTDIQRDAVRIFNFLKVSLNLLGEKVNFNGYPNKPINFVSTVTI
jgi:hypothetical protein